ncbi:DinB family protein [Dictyobacter aurantiacus]|uniref:Damage-inducible protein DinB n=1 Tax=Dictyobacter aurantiacus TaxID=1936993 RepID=A0A401ZN30_9CHLR|nr:DinB family protein [Dictyobacter aurantiacus]GCE08166.1 hypothetical protein KDAU_54950 [Dictyobacter aurantiacus]
MTTGLPNFFEYNLWANLRLLDFCEQLSDEQLDATMTGVFGSIREVLMHLFASEEGYAYSFTKTRPSSPLKEEDSFVGFEELRRRAQLSGKALIDIAKERDLGETFWLDGGVYECQAYIVALQAISHGVDHRSQIATLLAQQGIELPALDAWGYNDALHSKQ